MQYDRLSQQQLGFLSTVVELDASALYTVCADLKTANVFLTHDGVLKIGDFGISRILTDTLDQANTVIGTPYYLSPEICQRRP